MASIKENSNKDSNTFSDKAGDAVQTVATGINQATEYVKEKVGLASEDKGISGIQERMDVIASCGSKVGVVDHIEGSTLKLTRKDSNDGQHHYIPLTDVAKVDEHVHLKINSKEFAEQSKTSAAACNC